MYSDNPTSRPYWLIWIFMKSPLFVIIDFCFVDSQPPNFPVILWLYFLRYEYPQRYILLLMINVFRHPDFPAIVTALLSTNYSSLCQETVWLLANIVNNESVVVQGHTFFWPRRFFFLQINLFFISNSFFLYIIQPFFFYRDGIFLQNVLTKTFFFFISNKIRMLFWFL